MSAPLNPIGETVGQYIEKLGFAVVPIPPGTKGPTREGWNKPGGYFTDADYARQFYVDHPDYNAGVLHAPSRTCVLDLDSQHSRGVLVALGIDLEHYLDERGPKSIGNPAKPAKLWYHVPDGIDLPTYKLVWPHPDGPDPVKGRPRVITIFELRAGAVQDVLPPSIHPDTKRPYTWLQSPFDVPLPVLPEELLELWLNFKSFEPHLKAACPWAPDEVLAKPVRSPPKKFNSGSGDAHNIINAFNAAHEVTAILESHRYRRKGKRRFLAPDSTTKLGGVVLLDDSHCYSHHGADPLADGHRHDAFDLHRLLDHGGDWGRAFADAKRELGLERKDGLAGTNQAEEEARDKPLITLEGGELSRVIDASEAALFAAENCPVYQRAGLLVRLVRTTHATTLGNLRRPVGSLIIAECAPAYIVEQFMQVADYQKWDARSKEYKRMDLPERYASTYTARRDWRAPELVATIEAPTLREDGSIIEAPGYDPDTGLYFEPNGFEFPPIPQRPSMDDAREALKVIEVPLKDFIFERDTDRTTAIAAILTALVRRSLDYAPLFAFNAPVAGSGKGLLASVVTLIATGRCATAITHTVDENEERKRLMSVLLEGDPIVCVDNIEKPFMSEPLCSILTMPIYKDRLLGRTQMVSAPTCVTVLATGNNLQVVGDLTRRVLPCAIDPQCEKPHERPFEVHLPTYVMAHRGDLVRAALTTLRAYHVAGRPKPEQVLTPFGGFEAWSDLVRSALVWLGLKDPCLGQLRWEGTDTVKRSLATVLAQWHRLFKTVPTTVAEAVKNAETDIELREALFEVAPGKEGTINSRSLGRWLTRNVNRIVGKLKFELRDPYGTRQRYSVTAVIAVRSTARERNGNVTNRVNPIEKSAESVVTDNKSLACPRCAGEGCAWCNSEHGPT